MKKETLKKHHQLRHHRSHRHCRRLLRHQLRQNVDEPPQRLLTKKNLTTMKNHRNISLIVLHCSATRVTQSFTIEQLEACHKARGYSSVGYHYYITRDGTLYPCRPENEVGAHALHFNKNSIGICYEGGLDAKGRPADTRTEAQKITMEELLRSLCVDFPDAEILGHCDLPGVRKACPCFDTRKWLKEIHFHI